MNSRARRLLCFIKVSSIIGAISGHSGSTVAHTSDTHHHVWNWLFPAEYPYVCGTHRPLSTRRRLFANVRAWGEEWLFAKARAWWEEHRRTLSRPRHILLKLFTHERAL